MIRTFEKQILKDIDFVSRFIAARNLCIENENSDYKLLKRDILETMSAIGYKFKNIKNQYITDVEEGDFIFRLMFDIKGESVLTYIYVLRGDAFLENGLSNFGFMLNEFDLSGHEINPKFGFSSRQNFSDYLKKMVSIFEDFKAEFLKRESHV